MKHLLVDRISPAMAAGVLVLLVAGGGYALAGGASGKINACSQKHTHILYTGKCKSGDHKLSWNRIGPQGQPGQRGIRGPAGPFPTTLPSGATVTGAYAFTGGTLASSGDDFGGTQISWPYRLSSPPAVHFIAVGGTVPAGCSGSAANPGAASGNVCIFESHKSGATSVGPCALDGTVCDASIGSDTYDELGLFIRGFGPSTSRWYDEGTWAVTG